jgi:hypothetical protein
MELLSDIAMSHLRNMEIKRCNSLVGSEHPEIVTTLRYVSIVQKIEGETFYELTCLILRIHTTHSRTCCKFIKSLTHETSTHGIRQSVSISFCLCEYNAIASLSIFMCKR